MVFGDGRDDGEVRLPAAGGQVRVPVDAADPQAAMVFGGDVPVAVDAEAAQADPGRLMTDLEVVEPADERLQGQPAGDDYMVSQDPILAARPAVPHDGT